MSEIKNIELVRALMCGLAFFSITRLVELFGTAVIEDKEKQKRLITELVIAFIFLFIIRTLY
mgnify:CR=1 FL=1